MQSIVKNEKSWQRTLAESITDVKTLCTLLEIEEASLGKYSQSIGQFPLRVPYGFVQRMKKKDPDDPLLRQVLPLEKEMEVVPGFNQNPVQENQYNPVPGLLHKYPGRVLLTLAGSCAVNCRYCFRRHFPYASNLPGQQGWQMALNYIANDKSIEEVIFSGGDPLVVKDSVLNDLVQQLILIPHLKRLRIHTRLPIMIPERITEEFISLLKKSGLQIVIVIHSNHANEIDSSVKSALQLIQEAGFALLNQSVLLKGVNDEVEALKDLSEVLFSVGVLPYYLHMLDPVQGSAHFLVSEKKACQLMKDLMSQLPGYLVPKLVREVPGEKSKSFIKV